VRDLIYLSLGAGVQSTTLLLMSNKGLRDCPRADAAIFADTGAEPVWVYRNLESLQKSSDIPIHFVSAGRKIDDLEIMRFVTPPLWSRSPEDGKPMPTRRQCTREYKIDPIEKKVRELMGYEKGQVVKHKATAMIGISLDEARRMKMSRTPWITNTYPLVESRMTRHDCLDLLKKYGIPRPLKSSCYFCPYHSDEFWQTLKTQFQEEWDKAVAYDKAMRNWRIDNFAGERFCHSSLKPLDEIDFTHGGQTTFDFFDNECEGMCGL
jgi:hypothetical protein